MSKAVMDALLMAIRHIPPKTSVLVQSGQGARYTSRGWLDFLKEHQMEVSISRRGNCHDDAVAESFFLSMELGRIKNKIATSRDEAKLKFLADTSKAISPINVDT